MVQGDCQRPCPVSATSIVASANLYNAPVVPRSLHHNDACSSDSALRASEGNKRPRLRATPEETLPSGKKLECVSRYDVLSINGSNCTTSGSSASSKTLQAEPSVSCTSLRHLALKIDDSDADQVVQYKVEEGKVAHKKAEQKRRNENSSLIIELEHCQSTFRIGTLFSPEDGSQDTIQEYLLSQSVL